MSIGTWCIGSWSRGFTFGRTALFGLQLGRWIRREVPTRSMLPVTSFPRNVHEPSFDLPLSKVDFINVSLRSDLLIVLNIKLFLCHGVLRCRDGFCVWERCRLERTCSCRIGGRSRQQTGGFLPLSLSIVRSRWQSVRVGFNAPQLGPWNPLIQSIIRAFVVDIGMTVGTPVLEDLNKLCCEHNGIMFEFRTSIRG